MLRAYWCRVLKRALHDTLHGFGLETRQRIVIRVVLAIGAIALITYLGSSDDVRSRILTALAATLVFAIWFVVMFSWNMANAPAKLDAEAAKDLREARGDISDAEHAEVTQQIRSLSKEQRAWLYRLLIGHSPNAMPDSVWQDMERGRKLLHRDGTGKQGVADRYRGVIADWFKANPQDRG